MKRPPEPLQKPEAKALVQQASLGRKHRTAVRDAAAVAVLWRSQVRVGELVNIRLVDYEEDRLRIMKPKGSMCKPRVVGIDTGARELLDAWVLLRPNSLWLFCTLPGHQINTSHYRRLFKRLQNNAAITKRCHPHGMRHTGAMELAKERVPLPFIAAQLGHANVSTTDEYLRHIAGQEVVDIVSNRKW